MSTGTADFKRHLFTVSKVLETVLHYDKHPDNLSNLLTDRLKFSKDRGYSQASGILYWLHLREAKKWGRQLTGLRPIGDNKYYGDMLINGKKSLLLFHFEKENGNLITDVFRGFYPSHKGILQKIIETHPYYFK